MPHNTSQVRNIEFFQKQAKKLLKHLRSHDPEAAKLLQAPHPHYAGVSPDQIFAQNLRLGDMQLVISRQHGFPSWKQMMAYMEGRPRRADGGIVISEKPGLTLEEALNDRASLAGMPPIGTVTTNIHGIEWQVVDYDFFPTPSTFARYPNDCDYLPIVALRNASQRLKDFIAEADRCTSKWIHFIDAMPGNHPFRLGQDIHCANFGGNPEESYIFLDAAHAHETTIAHELGHLWLIYVEGGDGCRSMRDRSDNGKINQLDFLQSFVLDLVVNDLIASRGFDMSLINNDQINSLTMLRDAIVLGHKPPTAREALLHSLTLAGAILEQKRWPDEMKVRLESLLDFYRAATPGIYQLAEKFIEIIRIHGYESKEARRRALDECINLGFQSTGDDFDLERDLQEVTLTESMQDKHPDQFAGLPVALKLEIGKAMARHAISGEGNVRIAADRIGWAQIIVDTSDSAKFSPIPVNYQLIPYQETQDFREMVHRPRVIGGKALNEYGLLPSDPGYNEGTPPNANPFPQIPALVNGQVPDQYGRLPGDPGYNTCYPRQDPVSRMKVEPPAQIGELKDKHVSNPHNRLPHDCFIGHYMAGVGLSVARSRLMQQMAKQRGNLYEYNFNNPVNFIDPSGESPVNMRAHENSSGAPPCDVHDILIFYKDLLSKYPHCTASPICCHCKYEAELDEVLIGLCRNPLCGSIVDNTSVVWFRLILREYFCNGVTCYATRCIQLAACGGDLRTLPQPPEFCNPCPTDTCPPCPTSRYDL